MALPFYKLNNRPYLKLIMSQNQLLTGHKNHYTTKKNQNQDQWDQLAYSKVKIVC